MVENILQQSNKHKICAEMHQFNKGKQMKTKSRFIEKYHKFEDI